MRKTSVLGAAAQLATFPDRRECEPDHTPRTRAALLRGWQVLIAGQARVVALEASPEQLALRLRRCDAPAFTELQSEALRQVLCAQPSKAVAAELGISRSSLAALMSASLRSIGLDPRLSRVPFVLAAMAHAAQSATERSAPFTMLEWSIALPRPEAASSKCLTVSERGVVQLLAEGSNGGDIARLRGTTRRTVANQSSVLFRKLNVSGRLELFACLWRCAQAPTLARSGRYDAPSASFL